MRWNTATGMARRFAGNLAGSSSSTVKQLQRAGDTLKELRRAPLRRLVTGHGHVRTSVIVENRLSIAARSRCDSQGQLHVQ